MRIPLDRQGNIPLYQQIGSFLRQSILSGNLSPHTRLPATRALAQDLGVNRITVETAYAELEADGLVFTHGGSGTYVLPTTPQISVPKEGLETSWPLWQQDLQDKSRIARRIRPEQVLRAAGHTDPISFAGGTSDSQLFPVDEYRKVLQAVMRRDGIEALEYGEHNGYAPLRNTIAHVLASQGIQARPENVLVTAGSQQALALVSQILMKPGDTILVETPTYAGALDLFRTLSFKIVGIPMDGSGMQVEKLEKLLQQHHPRLIYTIPNFHNPTGTCMNSQRRRQLLGLADRYNIPILEDDFVGDLRYEGRTQPALKSLDPGGRVIYVSTFSKMLMPGLRTGFLIAEGPIYENLIEYKRVNDLATSGLHQRALEAYVTVGRYQSHLRRSCQVFRKRRDAMLLAIRRYLPAESHFDIPQGGLFYWLYLPGGLSAEKLLSLACEEGVAYDPGKSFFANPDEGESYMRLNFVAQPPERIDEGMQRLGTAIWRLAIEK